MTEYSMTEEQDEIHYCEIHPDRETELRCNKCNRYMCAQCAVQTPVGYRCQQCVRQVDDKFFNVGSNDYLIVLGTAVGLSMVGGFIAKLFGFLLLTIFIGIFAGGVIVEMCQRAIQGRRGRNMAEYATAGVVIGGLLGGAIGAYLGYPDQYAEAVRQYEMLGRAVPSELTRSGYVFDNTLTISLLIYIGITAFAVYSRMKT